ncbi:MAG TPA: hypothetical protein VF384_19810 [Planctomycetota bacterium]
MRLVPLMALLFSVVSAVAQDWHIPDNLPGAGPCNVIPFGQGAGSFFSQCRYQQRCTAAELGATAGVITGLAFAPCLTGRLHYDSLEIVLDHIPASQPLSTTFANNLTLNAVTVLHAANYTWNVTSHVWNEVGLQIPFTYLGTDDLVVQITTVNATAPTLGMHIGTRQRVFWTAAAGTPPLTGSIDNSAQKIEVSMATAHTSSHGDGCPGSNGTPLLGFAGSPQLGQTLSVVLHNGGQFGVSLFFAGTTNGSPFPAELGFLGMPSCYAYTDLMVSSAIGHTPGGSGSLHVPIPSSAPPGFLFYGQFACLDLGVNPFGFTTSNYGRVLVGH